MGWFTFYERNNDAKKRPSNAQENCSTADPPENGNEDIKVVEKKKTHPMVSSEKKLAIYNRVVLLKQNGRYGHGEVSRISSLFNVSCRTVQRIVEKVPPDISTLSIELPDFTPKYVGNSGRKPKYNTPDILSALESAPVVLRGTLRDSAAVVGCSYSTIF